MADSVQVESTVTEQVNTKEVKEAEVNGDSNGKAADKVESNGKEETQDKSALFGKIMKQLEYYFGDYNLPRDKFMKEEIKKDDGWIPLSTMLNFSRLNAISNEASVIVSAIKAAEKTIMEVDESEEKMRRSTKHPLPEMDDAVEEDAQKRTIYCKGFPKDGSITLDKLFAFFKPHGEYDAVKMRHFFDKSKNLAGFKGSVLVVFKTQEAAKAFIDGPATQYHKTYLIKKWFKDYLGEKKQEFEDRRAKKQQKQEEGQTKDTVEEIPKGSFLKAEGFAEGTSREDIMGAVQDLTGDCQFVEFKKGDEVAFLRFSGDNKTMLAVLQESLMVKDAKLTLSIVEGEEEEEQINKAMEAKKRAMSQGGRGRKRKGGFGGRGGKAKRGRR